MKPYTTICITIVILCSSYALAGTWQTIDVPTNMGSGTQVFGISGNRITGTYLDLSGEHSFIYDGSTWANIDVPGAKSTMANDIYSNNVVGAYNTTNGQTYSFLYNGSSWTTLSNGGITSIYANAIYGSKIVGNYIDSGKIHGFIYDGANWTLVDKPGSVSTSFSDIYGNDIAGGYGDTSMVYHAFIYNQGNWFNIPNNPWTSAAVTAGVSGKYIICSYGSFGTTGAYGLLYDGANWAKLQVPGAAGTFVYGIDGDKVVGSYMITGNKIHGFVYTIPEPASALLIGTGIFFARIKRRQN